jgi:hypothetical protein
MQHRALDVGQQLVAPVERRAQRLMAGQRRAVSAGQELEAVVEMRREALDAERRRACGGKVERVRYSVEASAQSAR